MRKNEHSFQRSPDIHQKSSEGNIFTFHMESNTNSLTVERRPVRRLSPIPPTAHFPTVLEEPSSSSAEGSEGFNEVPVAFKENEGGENCVKHRRRLPYISSSMTKNKSSRSFDSGIACLLASGSSSPSPPLNNDRDGKNAYPPNSPVRSPVPSRSPVTPSKRASFHALSRPTPGNLVPTPGSPRSPYKQCKLGYLSSRRMSEQADRPVCNNNIGRTLSPCNTSFNKSPSPSYNSSSKSSPQLHGSPKLLPSYSLHSNESSGSPPKTPEISSPQSPAPSPPLARLSRRVLPETPGVKNTLAVNCTKTRPVRTSHHLVDNHKKYHISLSSHTSLDSGMYSRSNTSDSVNCCSRTNTSSPILHYSPTFSRQLNWRKSNILETSSNSSLPDTNVNTVRRQSLPDSEKALVEHKATKQLDNHNKYQKRPRPERANTCNDNDIGTDYIFRSYIKKLIMRPLVLIFNLNQNNFCHG